ncbi:OF BC1 COMPLEX KINASE 3, chloroplastic [Seminavis robusta]|uniref:OF BC1 COMPLEX KINASE 3, chloroplastic n=1 Tax=Seminavis robusta TaxID=568900 RepID=A0A9N8EIN7_9STRA|nr:OF BC1 COMPLEX KINASE 3, chloroplastic [Seminavis robusta]|eukprot:Sro1017_g231720.1 OF BC1 COMPLEX KINASE 3, chloroplastic (508) ;mRNA; r:9564-11305
MTSRLLRAAQRRPLITLGATTVAGTLGAASFVEFQATRNDQITLPRRYNWDALNDYWSIRPVSVAYRVLEIATALGPLVALYVWDFHILNTSNNDQTTRQHAQQWRDAFTQLGPAFVKAGQQLSIRPDLVSPIVLHELQKLCDAVTPVADEIALATLQQELHDLGNIFKNDLKLVASASLGQVYKGTLRSTGETVAVKVQRPNMRKSFSLDLFLLQQWGVFMDAWTSVITHQKPYHKEFLQTYASGSYGELDYELEARNQKQFQYEMKTRNSPIVIPNVYDQFTTQKVLTTKWIDGIRLSDSDPETIRRLIPVGVELFLCQLLDIGAFHADPHPGNLLVTPEGKLCLLDFGLCATVDPHARAAMSQAIVHLLKRDFHSLVHDDTKQLGFLPHDYDATELTPILTKILTGGLLDAGSNLQTRKRKLLEISNELNQVFFQYPFSVPPFFALVTRGLGLLEGIALTGDPDFDIFRASAPYATKRAMQMATRSWTTKQRNSSNPPNAMAVQ